MLNTIFNIVLLSVIIKSCCTVPYENRESKLERKISVLESTSNSGEDSEIEEARNYAKSRKFVQKKSEMVRWWEPQRPFFTPRNASQMFVVPASLRDGYPTAMTNDSFFVHKNNSKSKVKSSVVKEKSDTFKNKEKRSARTDFVLVDSQEKKEDDKTIEELLKLFNVTFANDKNEYNKSVMDKFENIIKEYIFNISGINETLTPLNLSLHLDDTLQELYNLLNKTENNAGTETDDGNFDWEEETRESYYDSQGFEKDRSEDADLSEEELIKNYEHEIVEDLHKEFHSAGYYDDDSDLSQDELTKEIIRLRMELLNITKQQNLDYSEHLRELKKEFGLHPDHRKKRSVDIVDDIIAKEHNIKDDEEIKNMVKNLDKQLYDELYGEPNDDIPLGNVNLKYKEQREAYDEYMQRLNESRTQKPYNPYEHDVHIQDLMDGNPELEINQDLEFGFEKEGEDTEPQTFDLQKRIDETLNNIRSQVKKLNKIKDNFFGIHNTDHDLGDKKQSGIKLGSKTNDDKVSDKADSDHQEWHIDVQSAKKGFQEDGKVSMEEAKELLEQYEYLMNEKKNKSILAD